MTIIEKATIIHYHRHLLDKHTDEGIKSLGWKNVDSQTKRFEVLSRVGNLDQSSVLDIGCGLGDLKAFLDQKFAGFSYLGLDQMPEFIQKAIDRYTNELNTSFGLFELSNGILPKADYVFASGLLNYRSDVIGFDNEMIRKMFEASNVALAFNMLDASVFPEHPLLVGHDLDTIESYCRCLTSEVKVIRGYLEDDFTIFMYKNK